MADYFFRDDLEADKQRAADAAANGAAPTLAAPTTAAAPPPAAPPAPDYAAIGKAAAAPAPAAPAAAAAKPDYFADFRSALDSQDPFKQQTQKAISDTLANPTAGF